MRHAGLFLLLVTLLVPAASAHATLQSADPAASGHADEGVTEVTVRFTEDVEREYTDADVIDAQSESWKAGPITFDESQHSVIRIPVRPLESGIYSVSWKALSADTHTTRGTFVFAVGNATLRVGQYDPVVDVEDTGAVMRDGFARFAFYTGLFLAAGMPLFALVVLRAAPPRALYSSAAAFGLVGAAGAFVMLLFLGDRLGADLGAALATAPGRSILTRGLFVAGAAAAALWAAARPSDWRVASIVACLLGAGAILATATGSHAAALRDRTALYVAADAVHLFAAAVWIGGIVAFLHVLWGRGHVETSELVFRFGALAVPSVIFLLATGTLASLAHMPCFSEGLGACTQAIRSERYMQLVALKLALMVPLVALGALNKFAVAPRLARGAWTPASFRRVVQAEALLMALILGAAGVLAASSPPDREAELGTPGVPAVFEVQNFTAKSHVILQIAPNPVTVGVQRIVVVVHPLGPTLPNGTLVALKIWHESEEEPELTINPTKATPNEWEIEDGFFTSAGTWNVLVIVQRSDEYAKLTFQVPVINAR